MCENKVFIGLFTTNILGAACV